MDIELNTTEWPLIEPKLRENKALLQKLDAELRTSPVVARAIGRAVAQGWSKHGQHVGEYNRLRVLIGFQPATGLGVGVVVAVGVAIAVATLWAAIVAFNIWLLTREQEASAAQQAEQNRTALLSQAAQKENQAEQAQQRGDVEEARRLAAEAVALRQQAGTPGVAANGNGRTVLAGCRSFAGEMSGGFGKSALFPVSCDLCG